MSTTSTRPPRPEADHDYHIAHGAGRRPVGRRCRAQHGDLPGPNPGRAVTGTVPVIEGTVDIGPDGQPPAITGSLDLGAIDTGNARRDSDLRKPKFLDLDHHPTMTFGADTVTVSPTSWSVTGRLTARGTCARLAGGMELSGQDRSATPDRAHPARSPHPRHPGTQDHDRSPDRHHRHRDNPPDHRLVSRRIPAARTDPARPGHPRLCANNPPLRLCQCGERRADSRKTRTAWSSRHCGQPPGALAAA
jgi:hypothetical protein